MKAITRNLLIALCICAAAIVDASVYIKYANKDAQAYTMKVEIGGRTRTVDFGRDRNATVTIQGGGETAIIYTACDQVIVRDDDKIVIRNGCIIVK